jgi:hypothetical protein
MSPWPNCWIRLSCACMHAYVCVCACVPVCAWVPVCKCACMHVRARKCMRACVYARAYLRAVRVRAHMQCACACVCAYVCVCVCACSCVCLRARACVRASTAGVYACTCALWCSWCLGSWYMVLMKCNVHGIWCSYCLGLWYVLLTALQGFTMVICLCCLMLGRPRTNSSWVRSVGMSRFEAYRRF